MVFLLLTGRPNRAMKNAECINLKRIKQKKLILKNNFCFLNIDDF